LGRGDRRRGRPRHDGPHARPLQDHARKKCRVAAERDETKREAFQEAIEKIDPNDLVFLDESGFSLSLYRAYGWCARGERLVEAVPFCRGGNLSVLGALDREGMLCTREKDGARTGR
jgi:hypothetical protein